MAVLFCLSYNINMKKIAIIGNGTAGCLTAAHFNYFCKAEEIIWYYDPNIKPQAVGEGSLTDLPQDLHVTIDFSHTDLLNIGGTVKAGIRKIDWSGIDVFDENFGFGVHAMHFNAVKLQEFILNKIKNKSNVKIVEANVTTDDIDADHIVDCSGFPKDYSDYDISDYIPVNSAFVTQCNWDFPRFNHTLTIARPYGWVFGIPLQNRCAIGYIYNKDINTLEEIKEDVKNVFDKFQLTPSNITNHLSFKNYRRKLNFSNRISYNGNASFFLEPLEATTIALTNKNKKWAFEAAFNYRPLDQLNHEFWDTTDQIETVIMLHYFTGSKFKTAFWDYASERGNKKIELAMKTDSFRFFCKEGLKYDPGTFRSENIQYGTWSLSTIQQNLHQLNMKSKLEALGYGPL